MRDKESPDDARGAVDGPALYRAEAGRLRRFFRRTVRSEEELGDLVQEAFSRLAGRTSATQLLNPAAYLQRIARNLLVDRSRRRAAAPAVVHFDDQDCPELATAADQADAMEAHDLMAAYERAVEELPPRTREVFLLQRVGELSYQAVAVRLGISVRTVEWHIAEALVRIRRALDRG